MTDNSEDFLQAFKEFESFVVKASGLKDNFVSYSKALTTCFSLNKLPNLKEGDNYSFLKNAGDLRNLLSHTNDVCVPTQDFINHFKALTKKIEYPTKLMDIATQSPNILIATLNTPISNLVHQMNQKGIGHVPVVSNNQLIGVFSTTTFFEKYKDNGKINLDEEAIIKDFYPQILFSNHSTESYIFAPVSSYVYEYMNVIGKKKTPNDKRIVQILLTSNGKPNGKLLGIVTPSDFLKLKS